MDAPEIKKQFDTACQHFNNKEFFEAHEVWEDLWVEASGTRHPFLQGLIQIAVALHHAGNCNWVGMRKLFSSGLNYLERGKPDSDPIDVEALKSRVVDFALAVQKVIPDDQTKGEPKNGTALDLPFFELPMKGD